MLDRLRFRWTLPLLMMALNLCLCAIGAAPQAGSFTHGPQSRAMERQGEEVVQFAPTDMPPTSSLFKVAILFNLPAMFIGAFFHVLLRLEGDPSLIGISTIFVPCVWFPIGRWLDEHVAGRSRTRRLGKTELIRRSLLRALAVFILICAVFTFTPVYHHRTLETDFMSCVLALWTGAYIAASMWGERHDRWQAMSLGAK